MESLAMPVSKEKATKIAEKHLLLVKNVEKVEIFSTDEDGDEWVVHGTYPFDLEGHQWMQRFEVTIDSKGRVKSAKYSLL
jgi:hypothetical protein